MSALSQPEPIEPQLDASQIDMLRGLRGGALLPQLLRTWRDQAPQQLRDMQLAIDHHDAANLGTIAHGFKSASFSIGAKFVGEACARLEEAARHNDLSNALALFSELQQCYLRVQPELEQHLA